ncbi:hypothetical protein N0V88_006555 [Collariella sp. IMI 366227]|nr:hypothetical protein N0V88_006555 [Collariella sp. IMI 366227]
MTTPDNTWNTVKRKGRRLRTIPTPANSAADSLEDGIRPNPKTELSADDLWRYHQTVTKDWQATELWNQEPRFTQQDREFCSRLGLEAVESPAGFEFVDEETLVFGIHMELEIYNLALKTLPAIFVGASLQEWERVVNDKPDTEGAAGGVFKDGGYV